MTKYLVSVIIPTTDKELHLAKACEASILASTDENVQVHIVNLGKERSEQRNIGLDMATGQYVMYLDSDQFISSRLIGECVSLMHAGFMAVYIPEKIVTKGFFGYLRNWERAFYTSTPIDCVRFMRREICPKFDLELKGPEDSDHDRRVFGLRTTSKNWLYHDDNITLKDYLKKKAYYSKSMKEFQRRWPNDRVLNFWWRCFGVFFEQGKWRRVVRRPDLFLCVMALIFARGVVYLWNK